MRHGEPETAAVPPRGGEEASADGKKWGEEGGNTTDGRPRRQLFGELGDGNLGR